MKQNYSIMRSREIKQFFKIIEKQFGKIPELFEKNAFIQGKEKIYMITREVERIPLDELRINNLGLYVAELKNEQLRLSIEGSQIIGPTATKNVHELDKEEMKEWLKGKDLPCSKEYDGFVIIKYGEDYMGTGKYREGMILNFVPKARRLNEVH